MILSDRQYAVSRLQLEKLREALKHLRISDGGDSALRQIEASALESQIADIEEELAEYDLVKSGAMSFAESYSLADLPRVLIQARIAKRLSQTELADKLGMKPQQVQRYEATEYMSASLSRLIEVAEVLDVRVSGSFASNAPKPESTVFSWSEPAHVDWARFPLKEMAKRRWISGPDLAGAARDFFFSHAGPQFATALHRKKVRAENMPNEFSLLAWQARVLQKAHELEESQRIGTFELKDQWVSELVQLTREETGPAKAKDLLAEVGILLVIERHLTGTYLDGAAMKSRNDVPIIALTLRYDRLDNFWFVLFHELGHVLMHLYSYMGLDFFDEESARDTDVLENEADKFALDALIPPHLWKNCLSRFALTEEAVLLDAEKLDLHPSIIAGRIRKERANYVILNTLVGSGNVRRQLEGTA